MFSKFSKLPLPLRDSGNFLKTLKIRVKLILNRPRAHAITYTDQKNGCFQGEFKSASGSGPGGGGGGSKSAVRPALQRSGFQSCSGLKFSGPYFATAQKCMASPRGSSTLKLFPSAVDTYEIVCVKYITQVKYLRF